VCDAGAEFEAEAGDSKKAGKIWSMAFYRALNHMQI
jgi:hypothetical protein